MKTFKLSFGMLAGLLVSSLLLLTACGSGNTQENDASGEAAYTIGEPIEDSTYAVIVSSDYGSDTLTTNEFRRQLNLIRQQSPQMANMPPEQQRQMRRYVAEEFVLRHLLTGEANRLDLEADTADINEQMRNFRSRYGSEDEFQQALQASNLTEDSLRNMLAERSRLQVLQERMAESAADPTEADVDSFRQERAEEVQAQHILFRVDQNAPEAQADSVRQVAQSILDSAQAGTDFAELARRHSEGPTASEGGNLGYFSRGQMVPPFEEAAFALQDSGDIAEEPVRTRFGYHIIRLTDRRTGELMDTTEARQAMLQERQREAVQREMDELRSQATVRVNEDVVDADLNASDMSAG